MTCSSGILEKGWAWKFKSKFGRALRGNDFEWVILLVEFTGSLNALFFYAKQASEPVGLASSDLNQIWSAHTSQNTQAFPKFQVLVYAWFKRMICSRRRSMFSPSPPQSSGSHRTSRCTRTGASIVRKSFFKLFLSLTKCSYDVWYDVCWYDVCWTVSYMRLSSDSCVSRWTLMILQPPPSLFLIISVFVDFKVVCPSDSVFWSMSGQVFKKEKKKNERLRQNVSWSSKWSSNWSNQFILLNRQLVNREFVWPVLNLVLNSVLNSHLNSVLNSVPNSLPSSQFISHLTGPLFVVHSKVMVVRIVRREKRSHNRHSAQ